MGSRIRVEVVATDTTGNTTSALSNAIGPIVDDSDPGDPGDPGDLVILATRATW